MRDPDRSRARKFTAPLCPALVVIASPLSTLYTVTTCDSACWWVGTVGEGTDARREQRVAGRHVPAPPSSPTFQTIADDRDRSAVTNLVPSGETRCR
jgi:hypothetical protein